jgi:hypothetical protein
MARKSRRRLDSAQSAASMFASVLATDEEFAAGVHLKNPQTILTPAPQKPVKKPKTKSKKSSAR